MTEQKEAQSKMKMAVVCWFLGCLGIHRMMMGYPKWWHMWAANLLCGAGYIWALVDFVKILTGKMQMPDGRDLV